MGRLSFGEIFMVLLIVLILFGPKRLPELARSMGEAVREFKKGQSELEKTINEPATNEGEKASSDKEGQ